MPVDTSTGALQLREDQNIESKENIDKWISMLLETKTAGVAIAMLADIGEPALKPVLASMSKARDRETYENFSEVIYRLGPIAVEPLIHSLEDPNSQLHMSAAWMLGQLGDKRAVPPLINALQYEELWVRWAAVGALCYLRDERAVGPIILRLRDTSSTVRFTAVQALREIGTEEAIEPLQRFLEDKSPGFRKAAKEAIDAIRNRDAEKTKP